MRSTALRCVFAAALLLFLLAGEVEGTIHVGVHQDMCNKASETPSSGLNIIEQIESSGHMEATYVTNSDIDSAAKLANYDVIYLGAGGTEYEDDKLTTAAASALATWVNAGLGGVVFSSLSQVAIATARTTIAPLMPVAQSDTTYWCKPNTNYLRYYVNATSHYLFQGTNPTWPFSAWCFLTPDGVASGAQSLAYVSKYSGQCCTDVDTCTWSPPMNVAAEAIAVRTPGSGRTAFICTPYCGYDLYQPANLRSGFDDLLFKNSIEWVSGLCKSRNDCSNHGHCTGPSTCSCDDGWGGDPTCNTPTCTPDCVHGTCTGPNTCTCYNYWAGSTCNDGCLTGWYGSNCSVRDYIQDESFSEGPVKTNWTDWYSNTIASPIISANVDSCTAGGHTGSYRACFSSRAGSGVDFVQQGVYIFHNAANPPFLSLWIRSTFVAGSTNQLRVLLDGAIIHTETISTAKASYTQVVIDLSTRTTTDAEHLLRIESTNSATRGTFEVDDVQLVYGSCSPACVHGHCDYVSPSSSICDCDTHYTGSTCAAAVCGDGYLVFGLEACDDGDTTSGNGCSSTCTVETGWTCTPPAEGITSVCTTVCGDGNVTVGLEECDDGNNDDLDGCNSTCHVEVGWECLGSPSVCSSRCDDGIVAADEECDDGGLATGDGCDASCNFEPGWDCQGAPSVCQEESCGNSIRTRSEGCDDGGTVDGDGCSSSCQIEHGWTCTGDAFGLSTCSEVCGNGIQTVNEGCDDNNVANNDGCNSSCQVEGGWSCTGTEPSVCVEICGNSYITKSEECDDGNTANDDGCDSSCHIDAGWHCLGFPKSTCEEDVCGNGKLEPSEECDDDNTADHDGCSSSCTKEDGWVCTSVAYALSVCNEVCGNSYVTEGEECDDGNTANDDGCSKNCTIEAGYECFLLPNHQSTCQKKCGNGIVMNPPEQCDDGNQISGDGCSNCVIDSGWECTGEPSNCTEICGDGKITFAKCDDGNYIANDGCTNCKIDKGFTCTGVPSVCHDTCGDGIISVQEACDDHNTANGDGCSSACEIEGGDWVCVGEPSDCRQIGCPNGFVTLGEQCDDDNMIEDDGCNSSCMVLPGWDCGNNMTQPSVCRFEVCGDGVVTKSEQCDDHNLVNGDCCSSSCTLEYACTCVFLPGQSSSTCFVPEICGNGYTTDNEGCDDGNTISNDGCSSSCEIEDGWVCETTNTKPTECHLLQCGDGITEGDEECDDGNLNSTDGCSSNCTIELGYTCKGTLCRNYCGNGVRFPDTEQCDDGNRVNGDGCNSTCGIEEGWNCTDEVNCTENCLSTCWSTCGDGRIASNEECDDGNRYIGDGCDHLCQIEPYWKCVGVPSVCIVKKCNLMVTSLESTPARCGGSNTGEILVTANGTGVVSYKLTGGGRNLPSWEDAGHWINLAGGNYTVYLTLDMDTENCVISQPVNVSQPSALVSGQVALTWPTQCDSADGAISWSVSGGTPPYTYKMGNWTSTDGTFTGLTNMDWELVVATDANLCQISTPADKIPEKKECEYQGFQRFLNDIWSRGGPAGLAIICVAAGVVVLSMIGYCIWDHHATRREDKEDAAMDRAEATARAQGTEGVEVELVPAASASTNPM